MATTVPAGPTTGPTYLQNALEAIGNTPLVKLNKVTDGAECLVLAKVEYMNPGGSVKDRPAIAMLDAAEKDGLLKPGGTIVEPTSGNTGTGLAMAAAIRGYRCILVMPDKMSKEKIDLLRAYGADVVMTPTNVPADSPESYYGVANRLRPRFPARFSPISFTTTTIPKRTTTRPVRRFGSRPAARSRISSPASEPAARSREPRAISRSKIRRFTSSAPIPKARFIPATFRVRTHVEGIGMNYLPETVDLRVIDEIVRVSDRDSFLMARRITREEGLLVGGSSGTAAVAASNWRKTLPEDAIVVVIFPDSGRGYMSKIFSDDWMIANGFLADAKRRATVGDVLRAKTPLPPLITVQSNDTVKTALDLLRKYEISQIPVMRGHEDVGSVNDVGVMQAVFDHADILHQPVSEVMGRAFPDRSSSTKRSSAPTSC